jgi:hypothetical protein
MAELFGRTATHVKPFDSSLGQALMRILRFVFTEGNEANEVGMAETNFMDCGGKRSATPLWKLFLKTKSGVAAALCHRSPNLRV